MPIYNLECASCGHKFRKFLVMPPENRVCPECSEPAVVWQGQGPTQRIVEVRDNGLMPKKVEQLANISEMVQERSTKKSDGEVV